MNGGGGRLVVRAPFPRATLFTAGREEKRTKRGMERNGQGKPSMSNCKYFHPNDRMIFINEAGQGFAPPLPPPVFPNITPVERLYSSGSSFCCRGSRDGIHGLSVDRSIIVFTAADIGIILCRRRRHVKTPSREPGHCSTTPLFRMGTLDGIFERGRNRGYLFSR